MLYEPAGLSLHFLFKYTRSFVAPDFLKTSRHTSQQKGGQRRSFSKRFLIQAPVIIMKIIDSHLHFCPGYPHFDEIAIEAGHINNEEHLRECFQKYNIVGGIVMGNRGVHPDNHTYPDFLRYCVGVEARKLTPEKIQKTCDLVEENLKRNTCVGIKLYPGYDSIYVTDERFEPIYDLAKAYKKPVAIHTGQTAGSKAFIKYSHPLTLDEAAVRHPDVQFVMCHFGNPWLMDAAAVVEKNENVAADLSGLLEGKFDIPEFLEEQSGYISTLKTWLAYIRDYDKLMFGTDWPLANYEDYIEITKRLIPEKYWETVFYQAAERIYHCNF